MGMPPTAGDVSPVGRARAALTAPGALFEVVDEDVRGNTMGVFEHRRRSLRGLLEGSARFGDRTFVVDGDVRLSFAGHLEAVDALAWTLQEESGVQPGERVAIFAANRWEWIVAFWAVASVGAIPSAFNGWWTPEEAAHAIRLVEPVLVIGDRPRLERVEGLGSDVAVFDLDDVRSAIEARRGRKAVDHGSTEDSTAMLLFTSGTTGRAKAVMVPHRSIVGFVQVNVFGDALAAVAGGGGVPSAGEELPPADAVVLVTSPLFHTSMLQGMMMMAVERGSSMVLLPGRFDPERVLQAIEREQVTLWSALGSAAPRVCASPALGRYDTSSVRRLGIGGAPVSPAVQRQLREAFPSAARSLGMGYTSTEGGAVVANIGGPEYLANPTSTGRATVTTEIEIRDPLGQLLPDGEEGEIHVRSPYIMLGYWNDPEASAAVLKEGGWLAMGDVGRLENGLLFIDSRARDMILVSAENVSPTEVEYCLEEHPAVAEAAVLAVDDPVTGDAVCAVVNVRAGFEVTAGELEAWSRERLAHYKVPTRWHIVHEALPRTASGKLVKHQLRSLIDTGTLGLASG
jgi:acyl-CoA synthetase (AMP-forming)/AMP-acid ligase II